MKKNTILVLVLIVLAAIFIACAPIPAAAPAAPQVVRETVIVPQTVAVPVTAVPSTSEPAAAASECEEDIYVVTAPLVHPFLNIGEAAAYDAGKDLGVKVLYYTPTEFNMPKQLEMTEAALSIPCVVGLGLIAADPILFNGVLQEAVDRGLAVVQQSGCTPETPAATCFSGDLFQTYVDVAERMGELLEGKGKVVVAFGSPGNANHQKALDGIEAGLGKFPDIQIVDVLKDCDDIQGTVRCAETALAAHPDMNAYMGTGNQSAVGAAQVFPDAGRTDILIQGTDDDPVIVEGIKKGTITFSFAQQAYGLGYWLVYIPYQMHTKGVKPNAKFIDSRFTFIDKTNVDSYKETVKQNFEEVSKYIDTEVLK